MERDVDRALVRHVSPTAGLRARCVPVGGLSDRVPSRRLITRRLALALAVAAGIAAAGCGTDSSDAAAAAQITHTVQAALGALGAGNGHAFCALVTRAEQARLATEFARPSCAAAMSAVGSGQTSPHRAALRRAQVRKVTVTGARATVRAADIVLPNGQAKGFLTDNGPPTTLVRHGGRWLISG